MNTTDVELADNEPELQLGRSKGVFHHQATIVFDRPVMEFAGTFEANGDPLLRVNIISTPVPVVRPIGGQLFSGRFIGSVVSAPDSVYLVIETPTMLLGFECDNKLTKPPFQMLDCLLSAESVAVSSSPSNTTSNWLIREHFDGPNKSAVLTPEVAERARATDQRLGCNVRPQPLTPSLIRSETFWLDSEKTKIDFRKHGSFSRNEAFAVATHEVLGRSYRTSMNAEWVERNQVSHWLNELSKHPEEIDFPYVDASSKRAKAAHSEALKRVSMCESAAQHPKLRTLIGCLASKLLARHQAIIERLQELARLDASFKAETSLAIPVQSEQTSAICDSPRIAIPRSIAVARGVNAGSIRRTNARADRE